MKICYKEKDASMCNSTPVTGTLAPNASQL